VYQLERSGERIFAGKEKKTAMALHQGKLAKKLYPGKVKEGVGGERGGYKKGRPDYYDQSEKFSVPRN